MCCGLAFVIVPPAASTLVYGTWPPPANASGFENTHLLASLAFAIGINLIMMLSRQLGNRILFSLLTGYYHQPREEERIVLFLDVEGRLAERLGDKQFHRLLNQIFYPNGAQCSNQSPRRAWLQSAP